MYNNGIICLLILNLVVLVSCQGEETRRGFRIVAGRVASIKDYPYQVSFEKSGRHWCGGAIVAPSIIVSAAHCADHVKTLNPIPPELLRARVGCEESEVEGKIYSIQSVVIHEKYSPFAMTDDYDVSVCKTQQPFEFSDKIKPVPMVEQGDLPPEGEICTVTGWGYQDVIKVRQERSSRLLMVIEIPVVKHSFCESLFKTKYGNVISDTMICAGNKHGNMDACKGDSGGPLVINKKLAGVVAWGQGCGQEGIPGIYMSVAKFRPWIDNAIQKLEGKSKQSMKRLDWPQLPNLFVRPNADPALSPMRGDIETSNIFRNTKRRKKTRRSHPIV